MAKATKAATTRVKSDIYTAIAARIFKCDRKDVTPAQRNEAKAIVYKMYYSSTQYKGGSDGNDR